MTITNWDDIAVDRAVAILNQIHQMDPTVLPALINYRVPCNEILADHPTVQVGPIDKISNTGPAEVGLLGILNGIFGTVPGHGYGYIAAHYDDARNLTHFERMDRR